MIRQFDVRTNPERRSRDQIPYVVVLQSDRFDDTRGVVVAPLIREDRARPHSGLYPVVEVEGLRLVIVVSELAAAPRSLVSRPVANLLGDRDRIIAALDLLFTGI